MLRAFVNVCRHRGSVVLEGEAARASLQCPYHAWTYGLDGRLLRAPRAEREADFDADELGLRELAVDRWGPFVFVNPDPDAGPLADALGRAPELVREAGVDVDAAALPPPRRVRGRARTGRSSARTTSSATTARPRTRASRRSWTCARTPTSWPRQARSCWPSSGAVRPDGRAPFDAHGEVARGVFLFVWPNLTVNVMPGRPNLSLGPVLPDGPERTARWLDYFFAPDADEDWIEGLLAWDEQVGAEDLALVERVQRGVRAAGFESGTLLAGSERLVARFDDLVTASLEG